MYESRQSGYDINYFDILSAKANAISFSLLAFCVQRKGGDLSFFPFPSDVGCFELEGRRDRWPGLEGLAGGGQEKKKARKKTPLLISVSMLSRFSCAWLFCHPMNCSLPGFSVHGILQARILEWVTIFFSAQRANLRLFCLLHWQVSSLPLVPLGKLTLISGSSKDTTQPAPPTSWSSLAPCREEKRSSKWKEQLKWKSMSSLLCHYLKLIFCITSYNYI